MSMVLVVNAGSSSLKYQFVDADSGAVAAKGLIEQIGEPNGGCGIPSGSRASTSKRRSRMRAPHLPSSTPPSPSTAPTSPPTRRWRSGIGWSTAARAFAKPRASTTRCWRPWRS